MAPSADVVRATKEADLVHVRLPDGPSDGALCKGMPDGAGDCGGGAVGAYGDEVPPTMVLNPGIVSGSSSHKQLMYTNKIHGALLCTPAKQVTAKNKRQGRNIIASVAQEYQARKQACFRLDDGGAGNCPTHKEELVPRLQTDG